MCASAPQLFRIVDDYMIPSPHGSPTLCGLLNHPLLLLALSPHSTLPPPAPRPVPFILSDAQLRLEVDSFATADTLRLGLMAASRTQPTPPPPPAATASEVNQQQRRHEHQQAAGAAPPAQDQDPQAPPPDHEGLSLSSVRPGHHSSQIYDPDAALSVAALLAKEMEQERLQALQALQEGTRGGEHGAMWASARNCYLPEASAPAAGEEGQAPKPLLKRSASMNSMVGSGLAEKKPPAVDPATNRRSLPRGYGGPMIAPGAGGGEELVVVDAKASLRRLYDAIEGRGMVAIKRNPNGKGRSRVMVRSRIKDKTIGWAHVLPPFTRKFVNVRELVGAQRSSRVVTVKFKNREPVSSRFLLLIMRVFEEAQQFVVREGGSFSGQVAPPRRRVVSARVYACFVQKRISCRRAPAPHMRWKKSPFSLAFHALVDRPVAHPALADTTYPPHPNPRPSCFLLSRARLLRRCLPASFLFSALRGSLCCSALSRWSCCVVLCFFVSGCRRCRFCCCGSGHVRDR